MERYRVVLSARQVGEIRVSSMRRGCSPHGRTVATRTALPVAWDDVAGPLLSRSLPRPLRIVDWRRDGNRRNSSLRLGCVFLIFAGTPQAGSIRCAIFLLG